MVIFFFTCICFDPRILGPGSHRRGTGNDRTAGDRRVRTDRETTWTLPLTPDLDDGTYQGIGG